MTDRDPFPKASGYRDFEFGEVLNVRCSVCGQSVPAIPKFKGARTYLVSVHNEPTIGAPCQGMNYEVGDGVQAPLPEGVRRPVSKALNEARAERNRRRTEILIKRFSRRKR